jgi:hypothetical protein
MFKTTWQAIKAWIVQKQPMPLVLSVKGFYVAGRRNLQAQAELFWDAGDTRIYNGKKITVDRNWDDVWVVEIDDGRKFTLDTDDYKTILV